MQETIIISLGGSLIIPNEIDMDFLESFKSLIVSQVAKGKRFVIITGGGKIARKYQDALKEISKPSSEDLDWLGIYSTRFNAEFLRLLLGVELAEDTIVCNPDESFAFTKPIVVGAGLKPGNSTDFGSVLFAKKLGAKKVINLSNVDYAYDKDPNKFPDAEKIEQISWADYRALIPAAWDPGLSTPFDPIASKMAEAEGMEVVILNGKNIFNLESYLNGETFLGTRIT